MNALPGCLRAPEPAKPISIVARELIERALEPDWPTTPRELARAFSRWVDELPRPMGTNT